MTKTYQKKMPLLWWLQRPAYTKFMLREITSVFVALYLVTLLLFVMKIGQGPAEMSAHLEKLASPGWLFFHVIALLFALFHTITWFNLTPKVMVVWRGEEKLPGWLLAGSNYVAWIAVSAVVVWGVL